MSLMQMILQGLRLCMTGLKKRTRKGDTWCMSSSLALLNTYKTFHNLNLLWIEASSTQAGLPPSIHPPGHAEATCNLNCNSNLKCFPDLLNRNNQNTLCTGSPGALESHTLGLAVFASLLLGVWMRVLPGAKGQWWAGALCWEGWCQVRWGCRRAWVLLQVIWWRLMAPALLDLSLHWVRSCMRFVSTSVVSGPTSAQRQDSWVRLLCSCPGNFGCLWGWRSDALSIPCSWVQLPAAWMHASKSSARVSHIAASAHRLSCAPWSRVWPHCSVPGGYMIATGTALPSGAQQWLAPGLHAPTLNNNYRFSLMRVSFFGMCLQRIPKYLLLGLSLWYLTLFQSKLTAELSCSHYLCNASNNLYCVLTTYLHSFKLQLSVNSIGID